MSPHVARKAAANLLQRLSAAQGRVVLSAGAVPFGYATPDRPYIVDTDASFASVIGKYDGYRRLSPRISERHHEAEGRALQGAAFSTFASPWAAAEAIQYYDLDPGRVKVVPRGAGVPGLQSQLAAERAIAERDLSAPRLVMIGVDWERKGGPRVLEVVRSLRRGGLDASLTVIGPRAPREASDLPFVTVTGYLSKHRPDHLRLLESTLAGSAYLLLLSRAEAFGIAPAEGNAYAVPCAVSDVDGLHYVVQDEPPSGRRFSLWASPDDIAGALAADLADRPTYERLAMGAYTAFRETLNWDAACRAYSQLIGAALSGHPPE